MQVATYEATVENGQIRLPSNLRLPENAKVYIVVPGAETTPTGYIASPRLVHPELVKDFVLTVQENRNAGV
jgi:hypothetical protein